MKKSRATPSAFSAMGWSWPAAWVLTLGAVTVAAAAIAAYALFAERFIAAAYQSQGPLWMNALITNREVALDVHLARGRLLFSRLCFLGVFGYGASLAWIARARVRRALRDFFGASGDPLNLAIFRIAVFWLLFHMASLDQALWFSRMPADLQAPPFGSAWLAHLVPMTEPWVRGAWVGLRAACVLAIIGFWTRPAAAVAAVLSVYVLGIPQWYGKVTHYHHLVWFAALLAASRCGDALSVDALRRAWRRARNGLVEPPAAARAYALPIRFAWLLLGVLYFFPGFWKWWASGIDWVWSDNLKFWMYSKWAEGSGWMPAWRVDQMPWLYRIGGAATLIFEMGFLWCMVAPRLRAVAAVSGLAFHRATTLTMHIPFSHLQPLYVIFVNWAGLLRRLGRRWFAQEMLVAYDGNCGLCWRTVALLRGMDWLGRIAYVNALDASALRARGLEWLDPDDLLVDMHAVIGRRAWKGFDAYRMLAWRVPILWPVACLAYLPPVPQVGRWIYRRIADHRACELPATPAPAPSTQPTGLPAAPESGAGHAAQAGGSPVGVRAVVTVAAVLLAGNVYCGLRGFELAWPFACYPTFRHLQPSTVDAIAIVVTDEAGRQTTLDDTGLRLRSSTVRWKGLMKSVLHTKVETVRRSQLAALWRLCVQQEPALADAREVHFYQVTRSLVPEHRTQPPLARELLWVLPLVPARVSSASHGGR